MGGADGAGGISPLAGEKAFSGICEGLVPEQVLGKRKRGGSKPAH